MSIEFKCPFEQTSSCYALRFTNWWLDNLVLCPVHSCSTELSIISISLSRYFYVWTFPPNMFRSHLKKKGQRIKHIEINFDVKHQKQPHKCFIARISLAKEKNGERRGASEWARGRERGKMVYKCAWIIEFHWKKHFKFYVKHRPNQQTNLQY